MLSTYRLQLHQDFDFGRASEILPYLSRLGITHIYTSPILAACPGSTHGYDVTDPGEPSPELGGEPGRKLLAATIAEHGLGHLLDIVPNHMGTSRTNPYWEDLLRHGRRSRFASWFDVDWEAQAAEGHERIVLPVLGDEVERILERGELSLVTENDTIRLKYFNHSFPLDPATTTEIPPGEVVAWSAGTEGINRVRALLGRQHYRLAYWRRAAKDINYRRFFDVNELVALRMEDPAVFDAVHQRVLEWIARGDIHGLRVDHVDGLKDPLGYLDRLRTEADRARALRNAPTTRIPIVVEKILSPGERLRETWPVEGTTGYEFLNDLQAVFVDPEGFAAIRAAYLKLVRVPGFEAGFQWVAYRAKARVLRGSLRSDVRRLARLLHPIYRAAHRARPVARAALILALERLIAAFPVYRTYVDARPYPEGIHPDDARVIDDAVQRARQDQTTPVEMVDFIASVLRRDGWAGLSVPERSRRLEFIYRFQQTSGPAAAKGVEDTALYQYVPLVSLNEVGGEPERPLVYAVHRLHESSGQRAASWPRSLICTNTHDTKRSADVRARLDVLSEIPREWTSAVARWRTLNRRHRSRAGRRIVPDPNTEYLLYQTAVGMWPLSAHLEGAVPGIPGPDVLAEVGGRVQDYMRKAVREGKQRSTWTEADDDFEKKLGEFIMGLFDAERSRAWLVDVGALAARIQGAGFWNSLSRVAVHLTAPGTPDTYQGDELWNFTLVDPDNRRAVDYALRARLLQSVDRAASGQRKDLAPFLRELIANAADGRVKLYVVSRLLRERKRREELFTTGAYQPLTVEGARARHAFAFARIGASGPVITIASRLSLTLAGGRPPSAPGAWPETTIALPPEFPSGWTCVLGGHAVQAQSGQDGAFLALDDVLPILPVAVLVPRSGTEQQGYGEREAAADFAADLDPVLGEVSVIPQAPAPVGMVATTLRASISTTETSPDTPFAV